MGGSPHTGSLLWPVMVRHRSQLLAFFSSMDSGSLFRATSYDDGAHWTQPRQLSVPSNSSPFAVLSLKSGRLVCVRSVSYLREPTPPVAVGLRDAVPLMKARCQDACSPAHPVSNAPYAGNGV
jgi:predicted neuraminidase